MAKKFQLQVAEPCHENWDNMTPSEKGRFCDACQKQVVDFSEMSDREIAQFFKKPSTGSVCGRFMTDQLERPIIPEKKRIPWVKYFFQVALPAMLISKQGHTQGLLRYTPVKTTETEPPKRKLMGVLKRPVTNELKITVTDSATGLPIPYASVEVVDLGMNEATEINGDASLKFAAAFKNIEVVVSSVGYKEKTISIPVTAGIFDKAFVIRMENDVKELAEVAIVGYTGRKISVMMGAVSKVTSRMVYPERKIEEQLAPSKATIFPNPLPIGQSATIEVEAVTDGMIAATITHADGKLMSTYKWPAIKGMNRFIIHTDSRWSAGIYFVAMTTANGTPFKTQQLLIQ
jgi:hypothetical protein